MNAASRICIVVVNYRTPALTLQCAASLRDTLAQFPGAQLWIVENGSGDESAAQLQAARSGGSMGARIQVLALRENRGYAAGNNAALGAVLATAMPPDFVWLLNSDTVVRPHALCALVAAMDTNPRMGIAGSRLENGDETPQRSAFRFPGIPGEWEANVRWKLMTRWCARWQMAPPVPERAARVDWVPGASMLIRRAVLEQCGLLDQNFFMYFEDIDFCRRAAQAGWETWYIPASRVEHRGGASFNITSDQRHQQRMPRYWFEARRHYFLKYHGMRYAAAANLAWLAGFGLWRVRQFIQRKPDTDAPHLWRDFLQFHFLSEGAPR